MLEYALEIAFACCSITIDLEEWERISSLFRVLRAVGVSRVISLTGLSSFTRSMRTFEKL